LGTKSFLEPPILKSPCPVGAVLEDFRVISFWTFVGPLLGPSWRLILGPDWSKRGQDGSRGPSRTCKYQSPAFAKTLKNICFLQFFRVPGCPRQLGKAQEGSQEAFEWLQNLNPKIADIFTTSWTNFGTILGSILDSKWDEKVRPKMGRQGVVACLTHFVSMLAHL
jgi:hypothetical protein